MTLKDFVKKAIKGEINQDKFIYGKVNGNLSKIVKERTGVDISNYIMFIEGSEIIHVKREHGNKDVESKRGQIAIQESDYLLIPDIVKNADAIELSQHKNNRGWTCIKFIKQYKNKYYVVEQIREKKGVETKELSLQTMYIKKNLLP